MPPKKSAAQEAKASPATRAPAVPNKAPRTVSVSRLSQYEECSQLYKLTRIDNVLEAYTGTVYTEIGTACHGPLETFYGQFLLDEDAKYATPYEAMTAPGGYWDQQLAKYNLLGLKDHLQNYAHHTTQLYHRASAGYTGKDAIRKADGSVPKAPQMTTPWKDYAKANGLNALQAQIDSLAARADDTWKTIPLSQVYAESLGIMWPYQHPAAIASVVAVELPISEVMYQAQHADGSPMFDAGGLPVPSSIVRGPFPVWRDEAGKPKNYLFTASEFKLPAVGKDGKLIPDGNGDYVRRGDDLLFNGFIDLIARDEQGRVLIIDHKTNGGDAPSPSKVARHEQMLVYAFAVELLFGEQVYAIGMNHLRSNRLVLAPYDRKKGEAAMERLLSVVKGIEAQVFIKQNAEGYNTKCIQKGFRDTDPPKLCPGLQLCHPEIYSGYVKGGMVMAA